MTIGIERLAVYLPGEAVRFDALPEARHVDARGRELLALAAPCEDTVTMAATAAARVVRASGIGAHSIGLVTVASAHAAGAARPIAGHVHALLGLGASCRAVDVVAGSYASTATVVMAQDWVRAGGLRNRCALVVAADLVRVPPGSPNAVHQGAAAVAMLIGLQPQILILSDDGAPAIARRPAVPSPYRAALEQGFHAVRDAERPALEPGEGFSDRLARIVYQASTPASAEAAHRHLLSIDWHASTGRWPASDAEAEAALAAATREQVGAWTWVLSQVGACGTAAPWLGLAAIVEREGRRIGGRRLGMFAFGAGCGGEFFTGLVPAAVGQVAQTGLEEALAQRIVLDAGAWAARDGRLAGGEPPESFRGEFLYVTTRRRRRAYVATSAA